MKKSFEIILVSILLVQNVSPILINAEKVVNNIQESKKSTKSTSNQAKKDLLYNPQAPRGYVVDSKTNFKPNVSGKVNIINNLYDIDGPKDIIKGDDYVTTEQTTNNELTPGSEYTLSGGTVGGYNRHLENSINIAFDTSSGVDPNAKVTIMYPEALNIDGKLIDVELELSKFETYGNGTVNISDRLYYGQMYCGGMHGADVKYSLYEKGTTTPAEFGKNTRFILKQSSYVNSNSFISTYPDSGVDVVYNTGFTTSYNESTGVTVYDGVAEGTIGLYLKEDTSQFKYRYRNILGSGILLPGVLVSTSVPDEIFSDENKNGRLELNEDLNVKIKLENLKSVNDVNLPIRSKLLENLPSYLTYNGNLTVSNGSKLNGDLTNGTAVIDKINAASTTTIEFSLKLNSLPSGVETVSDSISTSGEAPTNIEKNDTSRLHSYDEMVIDRRPKSTITFTDASRNGKVEEGEEVSININLKNETDVSLRSVEVHDSLLSSLPEYVNLIGDVDYSGVGGGVTGNLTNDNLVISEIPANGTAEINYILEINNIPDSAMKLSSQVYSFDLAGDKNKDEASIDLNQAPKISVDSIAVVNKGAENVDYNSLFNVSSTDREDTDSTVNVDSSGVNLNQVGSYPVKFKSIDNDGIETIEESRVIVVDKNTVLNDDKTELIYAEDFVTNRDALKNIPSWVTFVANEANVLVIDTLTGEEITDYSVWAPNLANSKKPGIYLTKVFTDNSSKDVNVTVLDGNDNLDDQEPYIYAKSLYLEVGNTYNKTAAQHDLFAYDKQEGDITSKVSVNGLEAVDTDKVGVYPVTFTATDNDSNTKIRKEYVYVSSDETIVDETNTIGLNAKNFETNLETLNSKQSDKDGLIAFIKEQGNIVAQEIATGDPVDITFDEAQLTKIQNATKPGIYNLKVTASNGTVSLDKTISILVLDGSNNLDPELPYIYAENVEINEGETYDTGLLNIKNMHNVVVYDAKDGDIIRDTVVKGHTDVKPNKAGVYPVTFEIKDSDNNSEKITRYVTVKGKDSLNSDDDKIALNGKDIYTNITTLSTAQANVDSVKNFVAENGKVYAYKLENGEAVDVVYNQSDLEKLKDADKAGTYEVRVSATSGASTVSKTIKVVVSTGSDHIHADVPYITAKELNLDKGADYSQSMHEVFAYDKQDGDITNNVDIQGNVDTSKSGIYPVTFDVSDNAGNDVTISRNVIVGSEDMTLDANNKLALFGHGFVTNLDALNSNNVTSSAVQNFIKSNGEVSAYKMIDGTPVTVQYNASNIDEIKNATKPGEYPVTITAKEKGLMVQKTIKVIILDADSTLDNEKPYIFSKDIELFTNDLYETADLKAIAAHNVFAYDKQDGNITSSVKVTDATKVDTSKPGTYIVKFEAEDNEGNITPISSRVIVKGSDTIVDNSDTFALNASNTSTNLDSLKSVQSDDTLLRNFIIEQAQIDAFDLQTGETLDVELDSQAFTNIKNTTKPGNFPIQVTVNFNGKQLSKTIDFAVLDSNIVLEDINPYIYGNDVYLNTNDIYPSSEAEILALHEIFAYDKTYGDLTNNVQIEGDNLVKTDRPGVYLVKFTANDFDGNSANITKRVVVSDDTVKVDPEKTLAMTNSDFTTDLNTLSGLSDDAQLKAYISENGKVDAYDYQTGDKVDVTFNTTDLNNLKTASKPGIYPVEVSATLGSAVVKDTINITVLDKDTNIVDEKPYVYAKDVTVQQGETYSKELATMLNEHDVFAYDITDKEITSSVEVNQEQVDAINTNRIGVYPVTFTAHDNQGNSNSVTVRVIVEGDNTITDTDNTIGLVGQDITTNLDTLTSKQSNVAQIEEFIQAQGNIYAYSLLDGSDINVEYNTNDIDNLLTVDKPGTYSVVVTASKSGKFVEKIISINVLDGNNTVSDEEPYIYADNVNLNLGDTYSTAKEEVLNMHNVYAFDKKDKDITQNVKITSDLETINPNRAGVYPVTFSITDSDTNVKTVTSNVIVNSTDAVVENGLGLNSVDFTTNLDTLALNNASTLTKESFVTTNGQVYAYLMSDGSNVEVSYNTEDLEQLFTTQKPGTYEVRVLATKDGNTVSKTIKISVLSADIPLDDNEPYIYAEDVTIQKGSTYNTELSALIASHNVYAYDKQDGTTTNSVYVENENLIDTARAGVYPITFKVKDSNNNISEVKVNINVVSDDLLVENNIGLNAHGFTTNLDTLADNQSNNGKMEDFVKAQGDVYGFLYTDGSELPVTVDETNISTLLNVNKPGTYPVTITVSNNEKSASKQIFVNVLAGNDTITNDKPYVYAQDVTIPLNSLYSTDKADVIANHYAYAYDNQDGVITDSLKISGLDNIKTDKAGVYPITFEVEDKAGNKEEKTVRVIVSSDDQVVDVNNAIALVASDFTTNITTLNNNKADLTEFITQQAKIDAYHLSDGSKVEFTLDPSDLENLQSVDLPGTYGVNISVTEGDITINKTIDINILDGNTEVNAEKPYIYAQDVTLTQGSEYADGLEAASRLHNVYAFDKEDKQITDLVTENGLANVDTSRVGVYPVTFKVKDSNDNTNEITVRVVVTNDDTTSENGIGINANDFTTNLDTLLPAQGSVTDMENFVKAKGNAYAFMMNDGTSIDLNFDNTDINELINVNKPGTHTVTMTATKDGNTATKEITINVLDGNNTMDEQNPYVYAKDVNLSVGSQYLNDDASVILSHAAYAYDNQDGVLTNDLKITGAKNVDTSKAGVYPVTFEATDLSGNVTPVTVRVIVSSNDEVKDPSGTISLVASDFVTNINTLNSVQGKASDLEKFITEQAKVDAYSMLDGTPVTYTYNTDDIENIILVDKPGTYSVRVTANDGSASVSKEIEIVVLDADQMLDNDRPYIYAKDINLNKGDDYATSSEEAIELHDVYAFDTNDKTLTDKVKESGSTSVNTNKAGVYPITFTVTNSNEVTSTITRNVIVNDKDALTENGIGLNSSDFVTNLDTLSQKQSASDTLKQYVTESANVYAYRLSDGTEVPVTYNVTDIDNLSKVTKPGTYPVGVNASLEGKSITKTIKVTVLNASDNVENEKPYIYAKDVEINEGTSYDEALSEVITKHDVYAFDKKEGVLTSEVSYEFTKDLDVNKAGVYPITFKVKDLDNIENSITVRVIVKDKDAISENGIGLNGNDFVTNLETLDRDKDTTEKMETYIQSQADVYAYSMVDGTEVNVNYNTTDVSSLINANKPGTYSVRITASKDGTEVSKTVKVTVLAGNDSLDQSEPYITAQDLELTQNDPYLTDDASVLASHKVYAYDTQDGDLTNGIKITGNTDVDTSKPGVYPVTFEVSDKDGTKVSETVRVIVTGKDTITNDKLGITAGDFTTNLDTLKINQTDATSITNFVLTEGKVDAYVLADGTKLSVEINASDLDSLLNMSTAGTQTIRVTATNGVASIATSFKMNVLKGNDTWTESKPYITAKDLTINENDDYFRDLESMIVNHEIYAYDNKDGDITKNISFEGLENVNANRAGVYPITIKVSNKEGLANEITVRLLVEGKGITVDKDGTIGLSGNSFATNISELNKVQDSKNNLEKFVTENGDVYAQLIENGNNVDVTYDQDDIESLLNETKPSEHAIKVSATHDGKTVNKTIKVVVLGNDDIHTGSKPYIYAEDIIIDQGQEFATNKNEVIDAMNVFAYDREEGNMTLRVFMKNLGGININRPGVYVVDIQARDRSGNVTTTSARVIVKGSDAVLSSDTNVAITGKDLVSNLDTIQSFNTEKDLISYLSRENNANIYAIEMAGGRELPVTYNQEQLDKIKNADKPGIYPLEISTNKQGSTVSKTINITLLDEDKQIDDEKPYIYAQDLTLDKGVNYSLVKNEILGNHNVFAYDKLDKELTSKVEVLNQDKVNTNKVGVYPVTFKVTDDNENSDSITKNVIVRAPNTPLEENGDVALEAFDVETNTNTITENASDIESYLIDKARVNGFNTKDGSEAEISFDQNQLNALLSNTKPGTYPITITATSNESEVSKTISVFVLADDQAAADEKPYLYGEDIILNVGDKYRPELSTHNVYAYDKQDKVITDSVEMSGADKVNTSRPGVYLVELSVKDTDGNISKSTVRVGVKDENTIVDVENNIAIRVEDLVYKENELAKISSSKDLEELIRDSGKIYAFDTLTGENVDIAINSEDLERIINSKKNGVYEINISASPKVKATSLSTKFNMIIIGNKETISNNKPNIYADDLVLNYGSNYNVSAHNAFAYDTTDGDLTSNIEISGNQMVNTNKVGVYNVTFKVSNSSGTISTITRKVTVLEKEGVNIDTDGDGNPDVNVDIDGDGNPDTNVDIDGDGNPDTNIDTNGDGTPDTNVDTDGDGEGDTNIDTDGDGNPDVNVDIDGDGNPDVNVDIDGDGNPDVNVDIDGDGTPDTNVDTDGDGIPDTNVDTDGDGNPDVNVDIDGDGNPDVNVDIDGDGNPDVNVDTDGDGNPDVNVDIDGDGTPDTNVDTDGDGKPDANVDTDGDGKPDANVDTDGDGKPDTNVDTDGDGKPDTNVDTDVDGNPDTIIDTDVDGNPDTIIDTDGDEKNNDNIIDEVKKTPQEESLNGDNTDATKYTKVDVFTKDYASKVKNSKENKDNRLGTGILNETGLSYQNILPLSAAIPLLLVLRKKQSKN